jgi:hypothetical protein
MEKGIAEKNSHDHTARDRPDTMGKSPTVGNELYKNKSCIFLQTVLIVWMFSLIHGIILNVLYIPEQPIHVLILFSTFATDDITLHAHMSNT